MLRDTSPCLPARKVFIVSLPTSSHALLLLPRALPHTVIVSMGLPSSSCCFCHGPFHVLLFLPWTVPLLVTSMALPCILYLSHGSPASCFSHGFSHAFLFLPWTFPLVALSPTIPPTHSYFSDVSLRTFLQPRFRCNIPFVVVTTLKFSCVVWNTLITAVPRSCCVIHIMASTVLCYPFHAHALSQALYFIGFSPHSL